MAAIWSIPVSYTHLDVYKRQPHQHIRRGQADLRKIFAGGAAFARAGICHRAAILCLRAGARPQPQAGRD